MKRIRELLRAAYDAAVAAAQPERVLAGLELAPPAGRTVVVGAGKAGLGMARAVEARAPQPLTGLVIVPHGAPGRRPERVAVREAGHPVPDRDGVAATRELLGLLTGLVPADRVVLLLSGGASSLLCAPSGVTLEQKQELTRGLLRSGATIAEINTVRKHLSAVKGGWLARAAGPAAVVSLVISDCVGDDLATIGSGPAYPDPSTCAEARAILVRHGLLAPTLHLVETPKPGEDCFGRSTHRLLATNASARAAARDSLESAGYRVTDLGEAEGESRVLAQAHAARARALRPGEAIVSGGETTVTVTGDGVGGRNSEYALALALALDGLPGACALAAGTDGIDGTTTAAGAIIDPGTLDRARASGCDPASALARNDSGTCLAAAGDALVTGLTGTNVNDLRLLLMAHR